MSGDSEPRAYGLVLEGRNDHTYDAGGLRYFLAIERKSYERSRRRFLLLLVSLKRQSGTSERFSHWGPNIVRNFQGLESAQAVTVCERNPAALRPAARAYPGLHLSSDFSEVLRSPDGHRRCDQTQALTVELGSVVVVCGALRVQPGLQTNGVRANPTLRVPAPRR